MADFSLSLSYDSEDDTTSSFLSITTDDSYWDSTDDLYSSDSDSSDYVDDSDDDDDLFIGADMIGAPSAKKARRKVKKKAKKAKRSAKKKAKRAKKKIKKKAKSAKKKLKRKKNKSSDGAASSSSSGGFQSAKPSGSRNSSKGVEIGKDRKASRKAAKKQKKADKKQQRKEKRAQKKQDKKDKKATKKQEKQDKKDAKKKEKADKKEAADAQDNDNDTGSKEKKPGFFSRAKSAFSRSKGSGGGSGGGGSGGGEGGGGGGGGGFGFGGGEGGFASPQGQQTIIVQQQPAYGRPYVQPYQGVVTATDGLEGTPYESDAAIYAAEPLLAKESLDAYRRQSLVERGRSLQQQAANRMILERTRLLQSERAARQISEEAVQERQADEARLRALEERAEKLEDEADEDLDLNMLTDIQQEMQRETAAAEASRRPPIVVPTPSMGDRFEEIVQEDMAATKVENEMIVVSNANAREAARELGVYTTQDIQGREAVPFFPGPACRTAKCLERRNAELKRRLSENDPAIVGIKIEEPSTATVVTYDRPPHVSGEDRGFSNIFMFYATAYRQVIAELRDRKVDQTYDEEALELLVLFDYITLRGARQMVHISPLQVASKMLSLGYTHELVDSIYQNMVTLSTALITIAAVRTHNSTDGSRMAELDRRVITYATSLATLLGLKGERRESFVRFVVGLREQSPVDRAALTSAFPTQVEDTKSNDASKYASYSWGMTQVLRGIQDVIEDLADEGVPLKSSKVFAQFEEAHTCLISTTFVGRLGVRSGVACGTALKNWVSCAGNYFFDPKTVVAFDNASKAFEDWLRTNPSTNNSQVFSLWKSYIQLLKKKAGKNTSYVDNLPAIGFILDGGKAPANSSYDTTAIIRVAQKNLTTFTAPKIFERRLGMMLVDEHDTLELPFNTGPSQSLVHKNGSVDERYLYYKASGKVSDERAIGSAILNDGIVLSDKERAVISIASSGPEYEEEAHKRIGMIVSRWTSRKFEFSKLSLTTMVMVRAILGDSVWVNKTDNTPVSSERASYLWFRYAKKLNPNTVEENELDKRLLIKLAKVYDTSTFTLVSRFLILRRGLLDVSTFLARRIGYLFRDHMVGLDINVRQLVDTLLAIPNDDRKVWDALEKDARTAPRELTNAEQKAAVTESGLHTEQVERVVFALLLIPLFRGETEDVPLYSGQTTLLAQTTSDSDFLGKLMARISTVYGDKSRRYKFADHLRLARYYLDRADYLSSPHRGSDRKAADFNIAILDETIKTTSNPKCKALYEALYEAVLKSRPCPAARFFLFFEQPANTASSFVVDYTAGSYF